MIDNEFIDLSLSNIWKCWFEYKKGKKIGSEFLIFQDKLEANIQSIYADLNSGKYRHGEYRTFTVRDNKKREISVAEMRDRIVHRLVYDYLVPIFDKTFIYDAWSCRKGKGLFGAIKRAQSSLNSYPNCFVWRADVRKFFDNVEHEILFKLIEIKIKDEKALRVIREIIGSYQHGISIGNLTSQIFSNIYLNELDHFVKHEVKPLAYLRYGDDFIILRNFKDELVIDKNRITDFLKTNLRLDIHTRNNKIFKARHGLKFLGCVIYPKGRKLNKRVWDAVSRKLNIKNLPSYHGLVRSHSNPKKIKQLDWFLC